MKVKFRLAEEHIKLLDRACDGRHLGLSEMTEMKMPFISGLSDDEMSYYVKQVGGQVVGDFYCGTTCFTDEQAKIAAQAAANALNALECRQ